MPEELFDVAAPMKNGDDLQGRCFGAIDNQVGVNREELYLLLSQISAPVSGTGVCRQENDLVPNDRLNAVRDFIAALFLEVAPDLDQVERGFRRKNVAPRRSGLAFKSAR